MDDRGFQADVPDAVRLEGGATMPRIRPLVSKCLAAAVLLAGLAFAAVPRSHAEARGGVAGSAVFSTYCASCHGVDAKGDGPLADSLRYRPPDLTLIAKRNGGTYPAEKVFKIIDGRDPVKGHGGPEMPVWGDAFKNTTEGYKEADVKAKIEALVDHLKSIQAETRK
jgi:mono/diheme cytochrome c family protein